jgi:hypothetical protein
LPPFNLRPSRRSTSPTLLLMASLSLSLSPLLSQSLRVSPGAAGQARLGERLVAVGDGGVDRAGGWTRTSRDRYVRACRPRSTSRHVPGSSRQPHLRAAGQTITCGRDHLRGHARARLRGLVAVAAPPLPRNFARTKRSKGGMGWREVARPRTRCLSRLRLGGKLRGQAKKVVRVGMCGEVQVDDLVCCCCRCVRKQDRGGHEVHSNTVVLDRHTPGRHLLREHLQLDHVHAPAGRQDTRTSRRVGTHARRSSQPTAGRSCAPTSIGDEPAGWAAARAAGPRRRTRT